jgi:hypothetical protein
MTPADMEMAGGDGEARDGDARDGEAGPAQVQQPATQPVAPIPGDEQPPSY